MDENPYPVPERWAPWEPAKYVGEVEPPRDRLRPGDRWAANPFADSLLWDGEKWVDA